MDFNSFLTHISRLQEVPLGGLTSQFKMAPALRVSYDAERIAERNPRESAVLALFYPGAENKTQFLLTLRASYHGTHSSQISFPGGKKEPIDQNLVNTALREAQEEVGVKASEISIYRALTKTYIPPSNFWVAPFMGVIGQQPNFMANDEVARLIEVQLSDLLDDQFLVTKNLSTSYMKNVDVPCFLLNGQIVWGATAMILSEIKDLLNSAY